MAEQSEAKPKPSKKKGNVWARLGITVLVIFLAVGVLGAGTFAILYATTDLPDPNEDFTTNTTFIYYNDGESQLGSLAIQNRQTIPYDEMPQVMKDAVVAAENRTFWEDPGFSVPGMARGFWSILRGGQVQGGSTITQQYIKILYLDSGQRISRKVRELMLAIKMGREVPKQTILEGYLNTIYFGRGAYGIEAAAKSYFLKPASQLTLPEAAALAAILNNPAGLNPSGGDEKVERLLERYHYVLDGMLEMGTITQAEYDQAYQSLPEFPPVPVNDRYGGPKGFLIKMVEDELTELGFTETEIEGGGLRIVTTFDQDMQEAAVASAQKYTQIAAEEASTPQDPDELHVALSSVDTTTGGVLALYGGADFVENSRNWSTQPRAAASTFKAFAAVAGLRNGFTLNSILEGDTFVPRGDSQPVRNQGHVQYGPVTLRKAIADSVNTAFVDMTQEIPNGPEQVVEAANQSGAPTGPGWDLNNRIALGAAEVSPLNMANSYGTFADSGRYKKPHVVQKVTDAVGDVVYEADVTAEQNLEQEVAADLTSALTSVVTEGTGRRAAELGRPVAGKTGTHGVDDAIVTAWFVGYTRQISTAVMYVAGETGNEDLEPYKRPQDSTFFGSAYPLMTWLEYMEVASEGMPVLDFDRPSASATEEPTPTEEPTTIRPTETITQTAEPEPTRTETETVTPTPTEEPTPTPTRSPSPTPTRTEPPETSRPESPDPPVSPPTQEPEQEDDEPSAGRRPGPGGDRPTQEQTEPPAERPSPSRSPGGSGRNN